MNDLHFTATLLETRSVFFKMGAKQCGSDFDGLKHALDYIVVLLLLFLRESCSESNKHVYEI